jgi:hypothetical protein
MYDLPGCESIVRMYDRIDITEEPTKKASVIPLGCHWSIGRGGCPSPLEKTPRLPFRKQSMKLLWNGMDGTQGKIRDSQTASTKCLYVCLRNGRFSEVTDS